MTLRGGSNNLGVVFSLPVAVPEPSSMMLGGVSLSVLWFLARRRTNRHRVRARGAVLG